MDSDSITDKTMSPKISLVEEDEATNYYHGIPSNPRLIAKTTDRPWVVQRLKRKVLYIAGDHPMASGWRQLGIDIYTDLERHHVQWTSLDVARMGYDDDELPGPLIVWIGVLPSTLSPESGRRTALRCRKIIWDRGFVGVEVEIRESVVKRLARGPPLLDPLDVFLDEHYGLYERFTHGLGIPLASRNTPDMEGTASFFLDRDPNIQHTALLLATARHVLFPLDPHTPFESAEMKEVISIGQVSFNNHLHENVYKQISGKETDIRDLRLRYDTMEGSQDVAARRTNIKDRIGKQEAKVVEYTTIGEEMETNWGPEDSRVIGHLIFSPPQRSGVPPNPRAEHSVPHYTQDIAVIEVDPSKVDPLTFPGNFIDLRGLNSKVAETMMNPHPNNPLWTWPRDGLLPVRGIIPAEELNELKMVDKNGEKCNLVIKNGIASGVTIGQANNFESFTRIFSETASSVSIEWPIYPYGGKPFSTNGDSGALVVDGAGRMGGRPHLRGWMAGLVGYQLLYSRFFHHGDN